MLVRDRLHQDANTIDFLAIPPTSDHTTRSIATKIRTPVPPSLRTSMNAGRTVRKGSTTGTHLDATKPERDMATTSILMARPHPLRPGFRATVGGARRTTPTPLRTVPATNTTPTICTTHILTTIVAPVITPTLLPDHTPPVITGATRIGGTERVPGMAKGYLESSQARAKQRYHLFLEGGTAGGSRTKWRIAGS